MPEKPPLHKGRTPNYIRRECLDYYEETIRRYQEYLNLLNTQTQADMAQADGQLPYPKLYAVLKEHREAAEMYGKYGGLARLDITSGDSPIQGQYDWSKLTPEQAKEVEKLLKKATVD